jgi:hypothetical protein
MILMLLFTVTGCGENVFEGVANDDSLDAQLEEAKIALDDSNYSKAIELLEKLNSKKPNNQEVSQYLSNAYSGMAGLDTYDFLKTIDDLDEKGQSGSLDMIGKVLGDDEGSISANQVDYKLLYMDDAIYVMDDLIVARWIGGIERSALSNDDRLVQRGLLGLTRIVLLIGDLIIDQLGLQEMILTEEGIKVIYEDENPDFEGIFNSIIEEKFADDIVAIAEAIAVIEDLSGSDNDLHEDFTEFMNQLDGDRNRRINRAELETYLQNIINS